MSKLKEYALYAGVMPLVLLCAPLFALWLARADDGRT